MRSSTFSTEYGRRYSETSGRPRSSEYSRPNGRLCVFLHGAVLAAVVLVVVSNCAITEIPVVFETADEAWYWVSTNITPCEQEGWWHPAKVYMERAGNCMGFSALLAYFWCELGLDAACASVGNPPDHCVVICDGVLYEPQVYGMVLHGVAYDQIFSVGYIENVGAMPYNYEYGEPFGFRR